MSLVTEKDLQNTASQLQSALKGREPIPSISQGNPHLDLSHAYRIQQIQADWMLAEGEKLTGYKVGLTSQEAQKQFQVFHPDFGHLFASMAIENHGEIPMNRLIQPKIEGEVAFVLGKELKGPGITLGDVMLAVEYAVGAMEIVDSRIENWKIRAVDTIADNGSSALYVLGSVAKKIQDLDLSFMGMALSQNGEVMATGAAAAVMGNPLNAVVFLANELGKQGKVLLPGQVILSGSLSSMVSLRTGDSFQCEFQGLGQVSAHVVAGREVRHGSR